MSAKKRPDKPPTPRVDKLPQDTTITDEQPHPPSGNFQTMLNELCANAGLTFVPAVVVTTKSRLQSQPTRSTQPTTEEKASKALKQGKNREEKTDKVGGGSEKSSVTPAPPQDFDASSIDLAATDESLILLDVADQPKTYTVKDSGDYFKPSIHIELDPAEKVETVTQIFIRGWKIDLVMMEILKMCWSGCFRLHTINLWHTGLNDETLALLAVALRDVYAIRTLILDNNPVKGEEWYRLIDGEVSSLQNLSLRYNEITDVGAQSLSRFIGSVDGVNSKLISLNLAGNKITDIGGVCLADSLRLNRSLLVLNLAGNMIGDAAAKKFAENLSRFALTHEEVVARRKLIPPNFDSKFDGKSLASAAEFGGSGKFLRPGGTRYGRRHSATAQKSTSDLRRSSDQLRDRSTSPHVPSGPAAKTGKQKKSDPAPPAANTKGKGKAAKEGKETTKTPKGEKSKKGAAAAAAAAAEAVKTANHMSDISNEDTNSLYRDLDAATSVLVDSIERDENSTLFLRGNTTLISLNLSHNQITEVGGDALLWMVKWQLTMPPSQHPQNSASKGLMRLIIKNNKLSDSEGTISLINALLVTRNPMLLEAS